MMLPISRAFKHLNDRQGHWRKAFESDSCELACQTEYVECKFSGSRKQGRWVGKIENYLMP